jgi:hypothetical protein
MSPRGTKQKPIIYKIMSRPLSVSPDDIRTKLRLRDQLRAMDTRTDAQRWLGDPPPHRSALAQRDRR